MNINTVQGQIDSKDLGITLMHEHITFADWSMRQNFGSKFCQRDLIVEAAVKQFNKIKKFGVKSIVDATVPNIGRDVSIIHEVAEKTGLNFIVSSGFYYQEEPPLVNRPEDQIYKLLLEECKNGVDGTNIYPGIMKAASDKNGITSYTEKLHRAIGRVAADLNFPIFCHHDPATKCGNKILDILEDVGMSANKVIIGHVGDSNDIDYMKSLLSRGCYLGLDRFGFIDYDNNLQNRIQTILELHKAGHQDQILLSHDLAVFLGVFEDWEQFSKEELFNPKISYSFIFEEVIPLLLKKRMSEQDINQILINNPKQIFEN